MFDEYVEYDGLGLAELIANGDVRPSEVLEAAISRAESLNPELNAIVTPLYEHARQRAAGTLSGPFAGVPFLLKDAHHALRGTPMSNGSRLHQGEVSTDSAELVRRFLDAGVVVFGKTNTPEYKLSVFTMPEAWGPARNPWDRTRSAGGSSGGSAAAVAAGIAPMASATDEGGSIRMPASACGVFGLKPTRGRNPIGPDFSWEYEGMSTSHIVSRSVRDSAAMLDATEGVEPGSAYVAPGPTGFLAALEGQTGQLRVGMSTASEVFGESIDPQCVEAVRKTASLLEDLGHVVEEVPLPYDEWQVLRAAVILGATNMSAVASDLEAKYGRRKVRESLEDVVLLLAEVGRALPAEAAGTARLTGLRVGLALSRFHETYDLLLTPTLGRLPVPLDQAEPTQSERRLVHSLISPAARGLFRVPWLRERVMDAQMQVLAERVLHRTMAANLTGAPAMSVPMHHSPDDLPVGVQFLARFGDELMLLRVAAQLERAKPWRICV